MAKSKTTSAGGGKGRKKRSAKLTSDPPVIIGGGSVRVFFNSSGTEIIPSPRAGYRCFRLPSNIKNVGIFDGENLHNIPIKNPQIALVQCDDV